MKAKDAAGDWSPEAYGRFRDLRLRPALDLMARVGALPEGSIVDLGCGSGAVGPALAARFAGRVLTGIDTSSSMLERARATGAYGRLVQVDAARWQADGPVALIFSNAALQWLPDHERLLPELVGELAPGGVLAVQMPRQHAAPSHRFLREFAADMFPDRFDYADWQPPVGVALDYQRVLNPLGLLDIWETEYLQRLTPAAGGEGHPVRRFTESTALRPVLDRLDEAERARFLRRYDEALAAAYPVEVDGAVIFPFRRLFLVLSTLAA
ncbi:methyltransferase domain-containing protein [Frigidibacter sp. MR17.24]|uniref:methyltransferase domain-containing protein n=1 Tax=Frigidibacter sp. MR17.24 TaxID=3127345 RepID=UPI003012BA46